MVPDNRQGTLVATEQQESGPVVIASGAFTIYGLPNGGVHLAAKRDGQEEEEHYTLPATVVSMMMRGEGFFGRISRLMHRSRG